MALYVKIYGLYFSQQAMGVFSPLEKDEKTTVFMHRKIVTDIHKNTFRILRAAHYSCQNMFFIKHIG